MSVIDWFKTIPEKEKIAHLFALILCCKHIEIIMHSRKSLLFENEKPGVKKERERDSRFDVTMGCWDVAEVCKFTAAFILSKLTSFFDVNGISLYRDDGLAVLKETSCSEAERFKERQKSSGIRDFE